MLHPDQRVLLSGGHRELLRRRHRHRLLLTRLAVTPETPPADASRPGGGARMMTGVIAEPHPAEWQAFRTRLERWVRRRVNDVGDAEDLVQEILARASSRLPTLREQKQLLPWLDAMARNALVDYYRRRGRAPVTVALGGEESDLAAEKESEGERNRAALAACIRPMLDALPPLYRDAVRRVDLEGERQVDVAAELGLGLSALKSRVQRGRAMLREAFAACCAFRKDAAGRVVEFEPRAPDCPANRERRGTASDP